MTPSTYDFGTYRKGDTLIETPFKLERQIDGVSSDVDIRNAVITCMFKKKPTLPSALTISTTNGYIEITNGATGRFKFKPVLLDMEKGLYYYDVQFAFQDGQIKTYITGSIFIESDYSN